MIKDNFELKKNQFYVRDGFFMTKGINIYDKNTNNVNENGANNSIVYRLQLNKNQMFMYFGKKFQSMK